MKFTIFTASRGTFVGSVVDFHYLCVPVDDAAAISDFGNGTFNLSDESTVFSGQRLRTVSADINAFIP